MARVMSPEDVRDVTFTQTQTQTQTQLREGYDEREVDEFLDAFLDDVVHTLRAHESGLGRAAGTGAPATPTPGPLVERPSVGSRLLTRLRGDKG